MLVWHLWILFRKEIRIMKDYIKENSTLDKVFNIIVDTIKENDISFKDATNILYGVMEELKEVKINSSSLE